MKNALMVVCCAGLLLTAACGGSGDEPGPGADSTPDAVSSPAEIEETEESEEPEVAEGSMLVTGGEWSFDSAEVAVAGPLEVTFENTGELTHELRVVRPKKGSPPIAELARLETANEILKQVDEIGNTGRVFTGETSKPLKVELKPGDYAFMCLLESPRGRTHAWVGMFSELRVQ